MSYVRTLTATPVPRVDAVPFTTAAFREAPDVDGSPGTWTTLETIDLDTGPGVSPAGLDTDPNSPQERTFTTALATLDPAWYQVVFTDDLGGTDQSTPRYASTAGPDGDQFATASDLAARLGVTLTAGEQDRADALLISATGAVQTAAGQQISRVADDTLTVRGTREPTILLPERPVESVASVTVDGTAVTDWWVQNDELVRPCGFGHDGIEVTIVYTHGFDPVPEFVKALVLEMVVGVWVNPSNLVSERVGQVQVAYGVQSPPAGLTVSRETRRDLRRLLGRGSLSLPIR